MTTAQALTNAYKYLKNGDLTQYQKCVRLLDNEFIWDYPIEVSDRYRIMAGYMPRQRP